jgi:hypothetical protein
MHKGLGFRLVFILGSKAIRVSYNTCTTSHIYMLTPSVQSEREVLGRGD